MCADFFWEPTQELRNNIFFNHEFPCSGIPKCISWGLPTNPASQWVNALSIFMKGPRVEPSRSRFPPFLQVFRQGAQCISISHFRWAEEFQRVLEAEWFFSKVRTEDFFAGFFWMEIHGQLEVNTWNNGGNCLVFSDVVGCFCFCPQWREQWLWWI